MSEEILAKKAFNQKIQHKNEGQHGDEYGVGLKRDLEHPASGNILQRMGAFKRDYRRPENKDENCRRSRRGIIHAMTSARKTTTMKAKREIVG